MKFSATFFLVIFLIFLINLETTTSAVCYCPQRCRFVEKRYPVNQRKRATVPITCNCNPNC
ncbi:hypothetical protein RhiirA5_357207 [Rhizophagus irregularis]|uniref:Uncharacterized protein n=1 Tax=Rhizophagus irregularis TaxID=588596 RepID=A0A2I1E1E6_9GLOM|nr:hypothetical protein RhiirA5_357207 [Rhizophagus irregularis]PKC73829.1 hypothetical protein RhiirA1_410093 [Rhizophagus irregularis]PKY15954.1 hypothetical protein RhiirB3_402322 [Rhizophagus irregularis]PKY38511.1 hypothetical protein RhiirA4_392106 [Rhizophagus irregularis]